MLSLLVAALVTAAPISTPAPTPQPRAFTASMAARITEYGRRIYAEHRTPGFAIGIVENARVVYERGFGVADLKSKTAFSTSTQFDASGVGRSIAVGAVLIAQQDGKLKLNDPISKYLPTPPAGSGSIEATLRTAFDQPIAAAIVERAEGVPYSDFLEQRIFAPLVMTQSLLATDTGASDLATGYTGFINRFTPVRLEAGTDDVVTSIADIEKWDTDFPILLRVDAVRAMFTPAAPNDERTQLGMGWHIDQRGGKRFVWQNGRASGFRSMNALLPDDHVAVIVASNADDRRDGRVASPERIASFILDVVDPPQQQRLSNVVVQRATDWLNRLADGRIDRTQLTPAFSAYLTDALVSRENFAALGKLQSIVPFASWKSESGDTIYEFIVHYPHDTYHYRFGVTDDGKIDTLVLVP